MLPRRPSDWEDGLAGFRGDVSAGLWLVAQRFVVEIIYGIQASESERKARFLLRLVCNRNLVVRGETMLASAAAAQVKRRHATSIVKLIDGREAAFW
ncbi:MAG: hypothetical protein HYV26_00040 [Candidatus Hydrogenedentes bacterium]|nr:hypothetical protein [Candidatus Hydrogenedentota bacterium]